MPVRAGTLWDGVHLEVPVGNAVAVWRLISAGGERASDPGPGSHALRRRRRPRRRGQRHRLCPAPTPTGRPGPPPPPLESAPRNGRPGSPLAAAAAAVRASSSPPRAPAKYHTLRRPP